MLEPGENSYREFVTARRRHLRQTAYFLAGDWHLAEDLVQTMLTKLYLRWNRIRRRGDVDGYAYKALVNAYIDHTRRPARRESVASALPERGSADPAEGIDPVARNRLVEALADVAPVQRAVLVMRFWEDLSVAQVAAVLDCSTGNVKSQTSRGLERLRAVLGPAGLDALEEYR